MTRRLTESLYPVSACRNLILWREVRKVYTRREAWLWLRHHRRHGTPLAEQRQLIDQLVTGAYA